MLFSRLKSSSIVQTTCKPAASTMALAYIWELYIYDDAKLYVRLPLASSAIWFLKPSFDQEEVCLTIFIANYSRVYSCRPSCSYLQRSFIIDSSPDLQHAFSISDMCSCWNIIKASSILTCSWTKSQLYCSTLCNPAASIWFEIWGVVDPGQTI